ncbi:unnamed protein product, partial [Laminaria digitata]
ATAATPPAPSIPASGGMGTPSPQWRAYGGHWLVLPLVELSTVGRGAANDNNADGRPTLAVNLRWTRPNPAPAPIPDIASQGGGRSNTNDT